MDTTDQTAGDHHTRDVEQKSSIRSVDHDRDNREKPTENFRDSSEHREPQESRRALPEFSDHSRSEEIDNRKDRNLDSQLRGATPDTTDSETRGVHRMQILDTTDHPDGDHDNRRIGHNPDTQEGAQGGNHEHCTGDDFAEKNIEAMNAKYADSKEAHIKRVEKARGIDNEGLNEQGALAERGGGRVTGERGKIDDFKVVQAMDKEQNARESGDQKMDAREHAHEQSAAQQTTGNTDNEHKREMPGRDENREMRQHGKKDDTHAPITKEEIKQEEDKCANILQKVGMRSADADNSENATKL